LYLEERKGRGKIGRDHSNQRILEETVKCLRKGLEVEGKGKDNRICVADLL